MPKRNILVVLNVSNDSNFLSDSGYIFQKLLWVKLTKLDPQKRIFFLGHKKIEDFWGNRVTIIPFFDRFDKYSTRFHFNWYNLKNVLHKLPKMDLIFNNQPEHTLALKMFFSSEYGYPIPIVSYYHYLPFYYEGLKIVFDESQNLHNFSATYILGRNLEAMEISHLNLIGSNFGRKNCKRAYRERYKKELKQPFEVLSPPIEDKLFQLNKATSNKTVRVLYNQRLYKHYGTEQIIDLLDELSKNERFELIVTNPTGKRSRKRNSLDPNVNGIKTKLKQLSFVQVVKSPSRDDYHRLLSTIDFAIGPLKPSALWSMAVTDVLACGKPVLCPNIAAFPEIVRYSPNLLFNTTEEFKLKFKALAKRSDGLNIPSGKLRSNVRSYTETKIAKKMLKMINTL